MKRARNQKQHESRQTNAIFVSRLHAIEDWNTLARKADFRAAQLAEICDISLRQLERFFISENGIHPQDWLNELRLRQAVALIAQGKSVKEVAFELRYKRASYFSRAFKRAHGLSPAFMRRHGLHTPDVAKRDVMSAKDTPTPLNTNSNGVVIQVREKKRHKSPSVQIL